MKTYNIEEFFIADYGQIVDVYKKGVCTESYEKIGMTIIKRQKRYTTRYNDAIDGMEYTINTGISNTGDYVVENQIPLSTYIHTLYEETKNIEFLSKRIKKIIDKGVISMFDMRLLVKYLNNKSKFRKKENVIKEYEQEDLILKTNTTNTNSDKKYIDILTNKNNIEKPSAGIDKEIDEVLMILAQDKINPILIGHPGVGKSTIITEIAYRISKNQVPNFLKNKKIINLTTLINMDKYSEKLYIDILELIRDCRDNNNIIVIYDINILYSVNNFITNLIKFYIKEKGLKVIGIATNDEFKELKSNEEVRKNFAKIFIEEPNGKSLYQIVSKTFNDYSRKNKIKLFNNMDTVIKLLIDFTKEENRIWNCNNKTINTDIIYNPKLVIGIIDKIFAHAKVNNQKKLELVNLKYGIESCDKITDNKKTVILNAIDTEINIEKAEKVFRKHLKLTNI